VSAPSSSSAAAAASSTNTTTKPQRRPSLSALWHQSLAAGPLDALSALRRKRVRVVVHRNTGVRGWIDGRLTLFDKHLNMVLRDAAEHYVHIADSQVPPQIPPAQPVACWRTRRIPQLLVRGESVMSIGGAPAKGLTIGLPAAAREALLGRAVLHDPSGELPREVAMAAGRAAVSKAAALGWRNDDTGEENEGGARGADLMIGDDSGGYQWATRHEASEEEMEGFEVDDDHDHESIAEAAIEGEGKLGLGDELFEGVVTIEPQLAGKITGMLLEMDSPDIRALLASEAALRAKIEEAKLVLVSHSTLADAP
jgi:small nuclear ribonucleoprotein (snRNP)-like protein